MKVERFVIGMMGTNCYLVSNTETKECVIVDPAVYSEELAAHIRREELSVQAILLTHGHFDHIMGIDGFLKEYDVPVYAHREEAVLLNDADYNASSDYGRAYTYSGASHVEDGQILNLAGMQFQVIHTPGHTIGGCCYYAEAEKILFSGDTLFQMSVGRSDFPTGNGRQLIGSIQKKLMVLPEETIVYPGHMEQTTIGDEKRRNPYL